MPDFERVFDKMRLDLARNEEERQYAKGYIDGKKYARKELLYSVLFLGAVIGGIVLLGIV